MNLRENCEALAQLIRSKKYVTALTGAGVSTASGIPDFRGTNGLWKKYDPYEIFGLENFMREPRPFYEFALSFHKIMQEAKPNIIHTTLARLEHDAVLKALFTQNIDGLHKKAGSHNVFHLHGQGETAHCLSWHQEFDFNHILKVFANTSKVPKCPNCGGLIKPDITFFGEMLPPDFQYASEEAQKSDLMLVVGTSLTVAPANILPEITLNHGGDIVILNLSPTHLDAYAKITIHEELQKVFSTLSSALHY